MEIKKSCLHVKIKKKKNSGKSRWVSSSAQHCPLAHAGHSDQLKGAGSSSPAKAVLVCIQLTSLQSLDQLGHQGPHEVPFNTDPLPVFHIGGHSEKF